MTFNQASYPCPPRDFCCDGLYYEPDYRTERATFSMSCFWGPEALFGVQPGVVRTRVGYAGLGTVANPSYKSMFDYTETVDVEFDPLKTTYDKMLELFWNNHDPTARCTRQVIHPKLQKLSGIFRNSHFPPLLAVHVHHLLPLERTKGKGRADLGRSSTSSGQTDQNANLSGQRILRGGIVSSLLTKGI